MKYVLTSSKILTGIS